MMPDPSDQVATAQRGRDDRPRSSQSRDVVSAVAPSDHPAWNSFERGFSTRTVGAMRFCPCGRIFYNPNGGWDWDEGELEALAANAEATAVEWACGEVRIDGAEYALDCTCWHARGRQILGWLLNHDEEIAAFLTLEKKRKQGEAARSPVVEDAP